MPCREACAGDVPALIRIHIDAWQTAYRGLMPDELLDAIDRDHAMRRLEPALSQAPPLVFVTEVGGAVVGFCRFGLSREGDVPPRTAEVFAFNVAPGQWRRGLGRGLMTAVLNHLEVGAFRLCTLWVVAGNDRARGFYQALGFELDGAERVEGQDTSQPVSEVRYRKPLSTAA